MRRLFTEYGIVLIFLGLCAFLSAATIAEQVGGGASAGEDLAKRMIERFGAGARVVVVGGQGLEDQPFVEEAARTLSAAGATVVGRILGSPRDARLALEKLDKDGTPIDGIVASDRAGRWAVLGELDKRYPNLGAGGASQRSPVVLMPDPYHWPNFLKADNLRNIANQIAIIAILAVGMTLVVIAGGIDLSVGSMIALSAVIAAMLVRDFGGGKDASNAALIVCAATAVVCCGLLGLTNGLIVTQLRVPPFIATLGMMEVAGGLAELLSKHQTISELPVSATWLGRGAEFLGVPNAVVLMLALYAVAHVVMSRTTLGRYIYAVGGNTVAARLSGVPVTRVLLLTYIICGLLAGLGGVVMTSLFQGALSTYGNKYEMFVIAAVVVGGTSINGGEGNVLFTLIGALIIAVIQNGMNLMGLESAMQRIVLGGVIGAAVALDQINRPK
jgi:ribose transport system permease protein